MYLDNYGGNSCSSMVPPLASTHSWPYPTPDSPNTSPPSGKPSYLFAMDALRKGSSSSGSISPASLSSHLRYPFPFHFFIPLSTPPQDSSTQSLSCKNLGKETIPWTSITLWTSSRQSSRILNCWAQDNLSTRRQGASTPRTRGSSLSEPWGALSC